MNTLKELWLLLTISTLISFTVIGTYSLIMMKAPDYKFYWTEKIQSIRIAEIFLGVFAIFSGGIWFKYFITKSVGK